MWAPCGGCSWLRQCGSRATAFAWKHTHRGFFNKSLSGRGRQMFIKMKAECGMLLVGTWENGPSSPLLRGQTLSNMERKTGFDILGFFTIHFPLCRLGLKRHFKALWSHWLVAEVSRRSRQDVCLTCGISTSFLATTKVERKPKERPFLWLHKQWSNMYKCYQENLQNVCKLNSVNVIFETQKKFNQGKWKKMFFRVK